MATSGRLLRLLVFLWTVIFWPAGGGRAPLRAGSARNTGPARLDHTHAGRPGLAGKASALLLGNLGCLRRLWSQRLGSAPAVGPRCLAPGGCGLSLLAAIPAWISARWRPHDGLSGRSDWLRPRRRHGYAAGCDVRHRHAAVVRVV